MKDCAATNRVKATAAMRPGDVKSGNSKMSTSEEGSTSEIRLRLLDVAMFNVAADVDVVIVAAAATTWSKGRNPSLSAAKNVFVLTETGRLAEHFLGPTRPPDRRHPTTTTLETPPTFNAARAMVTVSRVSDHQSTPFLLEDTLNDGIFGVFRLALMP
jgi:hypothetical protein